MINQREIRTLSAYLDQQLNASDAARLETRLKTDPQLASVFNDLRAARGILQKLPARKAPRNFTLTRQMVGLKPPLPRAYPLFRLATVFASILFIFSFTVTALKPAFGFGAAAPAPALYMSGGDAAIESSSEEQSLPAAAPTDSIAGQNTRLIEPTPTFKDSPDAPAENQDTGTVTPPEVENEAPVPYIWSILFLIASLLSGLVMWVMYKSAQRKWR